MVGALARVMLNGHKLKSEARETKEKLGLDSPSENILHDNTAQAVEAPRGTLYHSYTFDKEGRVTRADVITPTAQNLANIEKDFRASAERLTHEPEGSLQAKLKMVARAYDPCISCSVHLVRLS